MKEDCSLDKYAGGIDENKQSYDKDIRRPLALKGKYLIRLGITLKLAGTFPNTNW